MIFPNVLIRQGITKGLFILNNKISFETTFLHLIKHIIAPHLTRIIFINTSKYDFHLHITTIYYPSTFCKKAQISAFKRCSNNITNKDSLCIFAVLHSAWCNGILASRNGFKYKYCHDQSFLCSIKIAF